MPNFSHAVAHSLISPEKQRTPALPLSIDSLATKGKKMLGEQERNMTTTHIQTIATRITKDDTANASRSRQIANRNEDLNNYARYGYTIAHTAVIEGTEFVTFVDTLTCTND